MNETLFRSILEHISIIECSREQLSAILDLMQCANESTDIVSINIAAEMCQTMLDELITEVGKIEQKVKEKET